MHTFLVYCQDKESDAKIPLGVLVDRRKSDRGDNGSGMLRLARKEFAEKGKEFSNISVWKVS